VSAELDVERRVSLALRYLEEGKGLIEKDLVQASEKLYKAAEETVKALAIRFGLGEVLKRLVRGAGGLLPSSRRPSRGYPRG
jgi:hypothetical protein